MFYRILTPFLICGLATIAIAQGNAKPKVSQSCEVPVNPGRSISPPQLIISPGPYYPSNATENGRPKVVILTVIVGTDGNARNPQVTQSDNPEFERAALDAIRHWRWEACFKSGNVRTG